MPAENTSMKPTKLILFPGPIYPWRAAEVFFILWSFANALQLVLSHPHMITSPVKGPKYVASSPRNFGSRFYGETRRSVDAGLDALHLGEQERKSITASVVSTVFMLNSAVGDFGERDPRQ